MKTICGSTPIITLQGGVLTDQDGRTGEIVANDQFQFDNPLQTDAKFTSGFSICPNTTLSVGGSAIFYQCLSGSFYNLYQQSQGKQCNEIYIYTVACEADGSQSADISSSPSTATMTMATTPAAPTPVTPTTPAAPFPVPNNGTVPGATGTGNGGANPTTSPTGSPSPSSFVPGSGAATIVIGGKVVALVAAIGAFAMF